MHCWKQLFDYDSKLLSDKMIKKFVQATYSKCESFWNLVKKFFNLANFRIPNNKKHEFATINATQNGE